MKLLLDTHVLLWFQSDDAKLSAAAKAAIEDPANERWLSPISLLEIALKNRLGKLPLPLPFGQLYPATLLADDIHLLQLEPQHIEPLTTLPMHHKDPFDRLIAATTLVEGLRLVSSDPMFDAYGLARLW
ncbi:MAG: type II toxin-antitoxin system VapC family toxin [Gemmataceae bacterium]|nr:type II toxin-antitoxin system VapC family toxin [Gemmataceae bacterium]MCI0741562.1 type II toxin-antitoxin system VapC family toxin [Gemmataceae bacterium]